MAEEKNDEDDSMTPEQRLAWLRERGVQIETAEERHIQKIRNIMNEEDNDDNNGKTKVSFVHIPTDSSIPMKELQISSSSLGDILPEYLRTYYFQESSSSSSSVDLELFRQNQNNNQSTSVQLASSTSTLGGNNNVVSDETLRLVAKKGSTETFPLVRAVESNSYIAVNAYIDEIGMLKRLPLNKRASDLAFRAGFNPPPKFYGHVFLGRISMRPALKNIDFKLGIDTSPNAPWLQRATMDNLEYQTATNTISGQQQQPDNNNGEDGISKVEANGLYSWTQTNEEIEIIVPIDEKNNEEATTATTATITKKDLCVAYHPKSIGISIKGKLILALDLYDRIDPDGCTWTMDRINVTTNIKIIITCEKVEALSWPRITY